MFEDWNKNSTDRDAGNTGYPSTEPEEYRRMVRFFHQAGIHVGTHAIGDRAIDWVVDTYAQVLADSPTPGLRSFWIGRSPFQSVQIELLVR